MRFRELIRRDRRLVTAACCLTAALIAIPAATALAGPVGATPPASAARSAADERSDLGAGFRARMRAGDLDGAADAARRYLARFPGDGVMDYNLACVEARRGVSGEAWPALARALASEQADPRLAERDPDLISLRADPRFAELLAACRARLRERAAAGGVALRDGYPGDDLALLPNDGSTPDAAWPAVTVQLEATGGGLTLRARVRDSRFHDRPQPWRNGDGLRVTVVAPARRDGSGFDGDRSLGFGFGLQDGLPIGALVERDGRGQSVTVLEFAPKVRLDDARTTAFYTIQIPWAALAPYAPPLDTLLGINVSYLSVSEDRTRRTVSLVPDPALGGGDSPWRRYVPVTFAPSDRSSPVLRGTLSNTIVEDNALGIDLVAWLARPTSATLRVELLDAGGRSVVTAGGEDEDVTASAGINRWQRAADLSALPTGPFRARAHLALAGRDTLRWETDLLRLEPGWLAQARQRLERLAPGDRPSVEYRLAAIENELARHDPRAPISALTTTLAEAGLLLRRAETTGTVLPDSGACLAAYRDAGGALRPCAVRIPTGFQPNGTSRLLLLLTGRGSGTARVGAAIAKALRGPADLVVLAPELPDPDLATAGADGAPADPAAAAAAALIWGRDRFGAREVVVAGVDAGAADALALSLARPSDCARVLLFVDARAEPWPDVSAPALANELRARRNQIPYTVVTSGTAAPPRAAPQPTRPGMPSAGDDIAAALRAAGYRVESQTRPGDAPTIPEAARALADWAGEAAPRR